MVEVLWQILDDKVLETDSSIAYLQDPEMSETDKVIGPCRHGFLKELRPYGMVDCSML